MVEQGRSAIFPLSPNETCRASSLSVAKVVNGGAILGFESFLAPRNAGTLGWLGSNGCLEDIFGILTEIQYRL
ncbi:hypothetical protein CMV_022937 [Castanea mollissima]|uniref:Uncharacterized protein n=1 Tax=Castanea mollissima TaxID=60419 RepID=A0A8J4VB51_9ROSI|nr:hypothetical protein CMV_022937 [Castanea mollissima]